MGSQAIHAIGATNLKDGERHYQAEPLTAAVLASVGSGDLGALLHRAKVLPEQPHAAWRMQLQHVSRPGGN